jgi:hypothetical protein
LYFLKHFLPGIALAAGCILIFIFLRARRPGDTAYGAAVGLALGAALLLFWVNGSVGIIGTAEEDANIMYYGVLAIGGIGGAIARFRPRGMAVALLASAIAQALTGVIALFAGLGSSGPIWPWDILAANGFFAALFLGSARLFLVSTRREK